MRLFQRHTGGGNVVGKDRTLRLAIGLRVSHGVVLKYRLRSRVPVGLGLLKLRSQLINLRPQDGILSASLVDSLFQVANMVDRYNTISGKYAQAAIVELTPGQCFPFTGFVVVALGKPNPQLLETILHLTAALPLG